MLINTPRFPPPVVRSPVLLRARVYALEDLSADEVTRILGAAFDVIALGWAAVSPDFVTNRNLAASLREETPWADYALGGEPGRDLSGALKRVRRTIVNVASVGYGSPLQAFTAPVGLALSVGKGIASLINELLNGAAERRSKDAETEGRVLSNTVLDATIDVSVDMRYEQLAAMELENDLQREELRRARIDNERRQFELARDVLALQERLNPDHRWTPDEAVRILNNVRVLESVELAAGLKLDVSVGDAIDAADDAR